MLFAPVSFLCRVCSCVTKVIYKICRRTSVTFLIRNIHQKSIRFCFFAIYSHTYIPPGNPSFALTGPLGPLWDLYGLTNSAREKTRLDIFVFLASQRIEMICTFFHSSEKLERICGNPGITIFPQRPISVRKFKFPNFLHFYEQLFSLA